MLGTVAEFPFELVLVVYIQSSNPEYPLNHGLFLHIRGAGVHSCPF